MADIENNELISADTENATPSTDKVEAPEIPDEEGGPRGLEPTRYGDWEKKGRCIDF